MNKYKNLHNFVTRSKRNEKYVYHVGDLAFDRLKDKKLAAHAKMVMDLQEAGILSMTQKKLEPGKYEYVAIRTNKRLGS
jgi:hypothetical protein